MTTNITIDKNQDQKSTEPNRRDEAGAANPSTWQLHWVHIWAIYNPVTNTIAGLFSLSATAPTLPSGYTHKAYVGAVYNNSSGNFISFFQRNNQARCTYGSFANFLTNGQIPLNEWNPLTPNIPPTARIAISYMALLASGVGVIFSLKGNDNGNAYYRYTIPGASGLTEVLFPVNESGNLYIKIIDVDNVHLQTTGWEF
ncbi:MAG: hypothetical protein HZA04_07990 [Nitrospinae bacterium]|nr:hypothetical protein [Nitrospinota bacterium]